MGWFDRLRNLIDVSINIDVGDTTDIDNVQVVSGRGDQPVGIDEEEDTLYVDSEVLDRNSQNEIQSVIRDAWEETGGVYRTTTQEDIEALESIEKDRVDETLDFFSPIISNRYLEILEPALYLRKIWESEDHVPAEEMRRRRKDIAQKFGQISYNIINLCSAGYFDEGRYLRELYNELKEEEDWKEGQYQEVFDEIVKNEPFTVFVSREDMTSDVEREIINKISKYQRYTVDIDFVDVRGMGHRNREKVRDAINSIESEANHFEYKILNDETEIVVRIRPELVELDNNNQTSQ